MNVLDVPLGPNDSSANTIRGYLVALAREVWEQDECFSGKRPFGNSGWQSDLYLGLINAGLIKGTLDEHGWIEDLPNDEQEKADDLIADALAEMEGERETLLDVLEGVMTGDDSAVKTAVAILNERPTA